MDYNQYAKTRNELMAGMSDADLDKFSKVYKGNIKVMPMIDTECDYRKHLADEAKVKADFEAKVAELANLPKPPDAVHNVYMAWHEVDDTSKPEIVHLEGKPDETRYSKAWKWVVEVNHADKVGKASGDGATTGTTTAGKRAVTIYKRNGNSLEVVGNFHTGSHACDLLKLDYAGVSANLVLRNNGYIVEQYTGTDFTDK